MDSYGHGDSGRFVERGQGMMLGCLLDEYVCNGCVCVCVYFFITINTKHREMWLSCYL